MAVFEATIMAVNLVEQGAKLNKWVVQVNYEGGMAIFVHEGLPSFAPQVGDLWTISLPYLIGRRPRDTDLVLAGRPNGSRKKRNGIAPLAARIRTPTAHS